MIGHQPRAIRFRGAKSTSWDGGLAVGCYDHWDPGVLPDDRLPLILNGELLNLDLAGPIGMRGGRKRFADAAAAAQTVNATVQWIGTYTTAAGVILNVIVAGGEIYTADYVTNDVTKVVTAANFVTAGVTAPAAPGRVVAAQLGDVLILARTGARPFTWDGTTGAGGLVSLTNAPAAVDAVAVYYAKAFFVKTSGPNTIVWSEENQPNTGYEAGGFNNAWDLSQTSADALIGLAATNEALYYFRITGVGSIRGAVSSTFQTDGVHDSIAQIGLGNRHQVAVAGNIVFWLDNDARPHAYVPGGGVVELWRQCARPFSEGLAASAGIFGVTGEPTSLDLGAGFAHEIYVDKHRNQLVCSYDGSSRRVVLRFDIGRLQFLGYWVFTGNLPGSFCHCGPSWFNAAKEWREIYVDTSGNVFHHESSLFDDETASASGTGITMTVVGPAHGYNKQLEYQFTQLDVITEQHAEQTISVGYLTSRQPKVSLTPADQSVVDALGGATGIEKRRAFGLNANGRWCRPVVAIASTTDFTGQRPVLMGWTLSAAVVGSGPAVS